MTSDAQARYAIYFVPAADSELYRFGSTMLGHIDRTPKTPANLASWNAAHMSRSCSQPDLIATGGNGLFYCFAQ